MTDDAALVLVVGDANPDLVLRGDVVPRFGQAEQLLDEADLVVGGSAAITAHALARLGRPVALAAAVGDDEFGARVLRELGGVGVDVHAVVRRDDRSTGLTVVLARADDRAMLTLPGAIPTLTAAEVRTAIDSLRPVGLRHLHVCSLFLQPRLTAELPDIFHDARAMGVSTSLDTNDDPSGTWCGVGPLLAHLDVLLPNRAEVTAIARIGDVRLAAAELASHGPLVVVKDGANGAFAITPSLELVDVGAFQATAIDTTGAGDTFGAAFLDSWLAGYPLAECLRVAALAGSLVVAAIGGTAAQPTRDDLIIAGRTS